MPNVEKGFAKGKPIYVGIDVHKRDWVVSVLCQGEEWIMQRWHRIEKDSLVGLPKNHA